jgi:hypothetical protein
MLLKEFFMKKSLCVLFAALLALLLVTCDSFAPPDGGDTPLFTEDGRPMVKLTINVGDNGTSRAMIGNQDQKDAVTHYEVAFLSGSNIYRTKWPKSAGSGTITVPTGAYATAADAVLFAGKADSTNGDTLLAIGAITATSDGGTGSTDITLSTNSVTFTLYALLSEADTSFKILGPTAATGLTNYATYAKIPGPGSTFNMFGVPGHGFSNTGTGYTSTIAGQFTINCGSSGTGNANYAGVWIKGPWDVISDVPANTEMPSGGTGLQVVTSVITPSSQSNVAAPTNGVFVFKIDVSSLGSDGYSKIYLNVPVNAINGNTSNDSSPVTAGNWYIRGGLNNSAVDEGSTSDGGAVVLEIKDVSSSKTVTITPGNPQ